MSETGNSGNPSATPGMGIMPRCYKAWKDSSHFFCFVLGLLMSDISGNDFWDAEPSLDQEASDSCNSFQTAVRQGGFDLVSRAEIIHLRASRVTFANV